MVPKFSFSCTIKLKSILSDLGLNCLFNENEAFFHGMTQNRDNVCLLVCLFTCLLIHLSSCLLRCFFAAWGEIVFAAKAQTMAKTTCLQMNKLSLYVLCNLQFDRDCAWITCYQKSSLKFKKRVHVCLCGLFVYEWSNSDEKHLCRCVDVDI